MAKGTKEARDYVMARSAGAIASLDAAQNALIEAMALFLSPEDDKKGAERKELLDAALEATNCARLALEDIDEEIGEVDMTATEPWDEDSDPDDDEED